MKRSYSRRELYALGEPLGDSATYRKAGGLVLGDGGGGGGGGQPSTTTQTAELPEWARPYAKNVLAKGAALTDINQNPYQQYGGNRIAGFSPLQMQSFQGAANMDAGPRGFQEQVGQYMSPYMQNVVDVEKRGAIRDYQVGNTMQQAQATQAGAFGGGREAIQRAERERGLMGTLGGIQARGAQAAYDQAANQFRQGIQQGVAVNQLQNQYGGQMQQQAQRPLDMAYQDFLNQQNYPYKQLGFMSDLVRGMPLGQKSTSSVYDQGPGMVQTLAGLGGAAYGFGKSGLFGKEGGLMTSYAEGGQIEDGEPVVRYADGGVTSQQNVESILSKLSDQQLQQAKEAALNRRDVEQAQMIDAEMAERASIRSGLGGAFNQIPVEQQEEMMAGGGIVAFAGGGSYLDKAEEARQQQMDYIRQATTPQTPEQQRADILAQRDVVKDLYGPSVVPKYLEEVKAERTALPEKMESEKGLAFAMASLGLLARKSKPGETRKTQLLAGLGEAGQQFAGEVGRLNKEHKEANRLLRQSEMQLATADQLYNNGMTDKAVARADKAQELKLKAAEKFADVAGDTSKMYAQLENTDLGKKASIYAAELGYKGHLASAAASMNKPSAQKEGAMAIFNDPSFAQGKSPEERYRLATERYLELTKTGMPGVGARIEATAREKAAKDYNDAIAPGGAARKEYNEIKKKGTLEQVKEFEDRLFNKYLTMHSGEAPQPAQGQPAPNAPAQQQTAPVAKPSLNEFLDAARKANRGVSDADLTKYYNNKYGK